MIAENPHARFTTHSPVRLPGPNGRPNHQALAQLLPRLKLRLRGTESIMGRPWARSGSPLARPAALPACASSSQHKPSRVQFPGLRTVF